MKSKRLISILLILVMLLSLLPVTAAAEGSAGTTTWKVENSGNRFTVTRTGDISAAVTVKYRTVSETAVAGTHFTAQSGVLNFPANEPSMDVTVTETSASASLDFYYLDGSPTRTYVFEVLSAENNARLAYCRRTLSYASSYKVAKTSLYEEKSVTVASGDTTVTDAGYANNACNPLTFSVWSGYSSAEQGYLKATGAELRARVNFSAKEVNDGYQYIQILIDDTSHSDSGAGDGNPGTISFSSYMAGFTIEGKGVDAYYGYQFPVAAYGTNCGHKDKPWSSDLGNTVGDLEQQYFKSGARADDGRMSVPASASTVSIRFNASGSDSDTWIARAVKAYLQAKDSAAPTVVGAYVTNGTYGYGDTITIALKFSEIVTVTYPDKLYVSTNLGSFYYQGGYGTNVLYFSGQLTGSTADSLQITGINLSGCYVNDLVGNRFTNSTYSRGFANVQYEGKAAVRFLNGGSSVRTDYVRLNGTYTFPQPASNWTAPAAGMVFDRYTVGETVYYPGDTMTVPSGTVDAQVVWKLDSFTIVFADYDGTPLQSGVLVYGSTPAFTGTAPQRDADAQYTYTFSGWTDGVNTYAPNDALPDATADVTYTAVYTGDQRSYTVSFLDYDGTQLQSETLAYGATPACAAPERSEDNDGVYTFAGWTDGENTYAPGAALPAVTGTTVYTAVFTTTPKYTVSFYDYDGETVLLTLRVPAGTVPVYTGETPVREETYNYNYTFAGWRSGTNTYAPTDELPAVYADVTYTANYTVLNRYDVEFKNYNGGLIASIRVTRGEIPVYPGAAPEKAEDNDGVYTFAGWTDGENTYAPGTALPAVTGWTVYTAVFTTTPKYTVVFYDDDGETALLTLCIPEGTAPVYTGAAPTKASTAQYAYTFSGWTDGENSYAPNAALPDVAADVTYTAVYTETYKYLVYFENYNGSRLQSDRFLDGTAPVYSRDTPVKPEDDAGVYTFEGWTSDGGVTVYAPGATLPIINGASVTYTAVFSTTPKHTVSFYDEDGETLLLSLHVPEGAAPVYTGDLPAKPEDEGGVYTFLGWVMYEGDGYCYQHGSVPLPAVGSEDVTYIAVYSTVLKRTVVFKDWDGTVLQALRVPEGTSPVYTGDTPVKAEDDYAVYTFDGWTDGAHTYYSYQTLPAVGTEDVTYTPVYYPTLKFTVVFKDWDGTVLDTQVVLWGEEPVLPPEPTRPSDAQYDYSFWQWYSIGGNGSPGIFSDTDFIAQYYLAVRSYPVTFINYDGTLLSVRTFAYGETPAYTGATPVKPADEDAWRFSGWTDGTTTYGPTDALPAVSGETAYTAVFEVAPKYTVTFYNYDGATVLQTSYVGEGVSPVYAGAAPEREKEWSYAYVFRGWQRGGTNELYAPGAALPAVYADEAYTASYTQLNRYAVEFHNYNGDLLKSYRFAKGEIPVYTYSLPVRPEDNAGVYTFAGWTDGTTTYGPTDALPAVAGTTVYTAVYTTTPKYAFTLLADENNETSTVLYVVSGTSVTLPECPFEAREGCVFFRWQLVGGHQYDPGESWTVTEPTTFYATWKAGYTIVFDPQNGEDPTTLTVENGARLTPPDVPERDGFVLVGWFEDGSAKEFDFNTYIRRNYTLRAVWAYAGVSAVRNWGGISSDGNYAAATDGDRTTLWSSALRSNDTTDLVLRADAYIQPTGCVIVSNGNFYSVGYNPSSWDLFACTDGSTWVRIGSAQNDATIAAGDRFAYRFSFSYDYSSVNYPSETFDPAQIRCFRLSVSGVRSGDRFEIGEFYLLGTEAEPIPPRTVTLVDPATGAQASVTVADGASFTLPGPGDDGFSFTAPAGKTFKGWTYEPDGNDYYTAGAPITVDGDLTWYVRWLDARTVTLVSGGASEAYVVADGDSFQLPAPDDEDFPFAVPEGMGLLGWRRGGEIFSSPGDLIIVQRDMTCTAVWAPQRTLAFLPGDGTGEPFEQTWLEGEEIDLPWGGFVFAAPEGKDFGGWLLNGAVWTDEYYTVTGDATFTARWIDPPVLTFVSAAGGSFTVPSHYGYSVRLPGADDENVLGHLTAPEGMLLDGWSSGGKTYKPGDYYYPVLGDVEFTAVWAQGCAVTVLPGWEGGGDAHTRTVLPGMTIDLPVYEFYGFTAPDSDTMRFLGWNVTVGDGESVFVLPWNDWTVTADTVVEGVWYEDTGAWARLLAAFADAAAGEENAMVTYPASGAPVITLAEDAVWTEEEADLLNIEEGSFVLDLCGHMLYCDAEAGTVNVFGGALTIRDTAGGGSIVGGYVGVGVWNGGVCTLESGTVTANYYGVYVWDGAFTMTGGTVISYYNSGVYLGGVEAVAAVSGGAIVSDYNCVYVDAGAAFTLSGGTVSSSGGYGGVTVAGCGDGDAGEIPSSFIMTGGTVSGGDSTGVLVLDGGAFTLSGGTVTGSRRGGVYVGDDSVFTMTGGAITNNGATAAELEQYFWTGSGGVIVIKSGGGDLAYYAGGVYVGDDSVFTMTGGAITNNGAIAVGGVLVDVGAEFTMTGGEIRGNRGLDGGGVVRNIRYSLGGSDDGDGGAYICVSGAPVIEGNFAMSEANGAWIPSDCFGDLLIAGPLTDGARIGVWQDVIPGSTTPFTLGLEGNGTTAAFFSDIEGWTVGTVLVDENWNIYKYDEQGNLCVVLGDILLPAAPDVVLHTEAALAVATPVVFMDGEEELFTVWVGEGMAPTAPADPEKAGYAFLGWVEELPEEGEEPEFYTFDEVLDDALILYAVWEQTAEPVTITTQPVDYVGPEGSTATFTVVAEGEGLTYQWYIKNPGASEFSLSTKTEAVYTTPLRTTSSGRELYCVITDANGNTVTTNTVTMTIGIPVEDIVIVRQPVDAVVAADGDYATFTVIATGADLTYQWYIKNPGASEFSLSTKTEAVYTTPVRAATSGRELYCVITDAHGNTVTTNTVTMTIGIPVEDIVIVRQPVDAVVAADGDYATFTVAATGEGLTYQWYIKNPGASEFSLSTKTEAVYTTPVRAATSGRELYCVITDAHGNTATTNTVTMTIGAPAPAIVITRQPVDAVVAADGDYATFTVVAEGEGLSYQWYIKNPGASEFSLSTKTEAVYTTPVRAATSGRELYCVITDAFGNTATTNTVTMTIGVSAEPIVITRQPVDVVVAADGDYATFTVVATGEGLTYQWYIRNPGASEFSLSTKTEAVYTTPVRAATSGRELYCVITDAHGNTVTTNTVTMTIGVPAEPIVITRQPVDAVVAADGDYATFTVVATGEGLTYQWYIRNPGASEFSLSTKTESVYTTPVRAATSGRELYSVITDAHGNTVTTNTVTMTIGAPAPAIVITSQPVDAVVAADGDYATFTVVAEGEGLTYQWYIKNPGASEFSLSTKTEAVYTTPVRAATSGRELYCVITDAHGNTVTTNTVTMTIGVPAEPIVITRQPVDVVVAADGDYATFTVAATGEGLTYQWYIKNPGASEFSLSTKTESVYTTPVRAATSGRELYCVITDAHGNTATTNTVTMTIG